MTAPSRARALVALILLYASAAQAAGFRSPGISPSELHARLGTPEAPALIVDVRSPGEFASGHIPGAINIPAPKVTVHLEEFRAAPGAVIYCNEGQFTRVAEQMLLRSRVKDFLHLDGGLTAWQHEGYEIEQGEP